MAPVLTGLGAAVVVVGVALLSIPAAVVVAGLELMALGTGLAVEQERRARRTAA